MRALRNLIERVWQRWLRGGADVPASVERVSLRPEAGVQPEPSARKRQRDVRGIEALEGRIAPATLVNPSTVTYVDLDGDLVTVKFTKNLFPTIAGVPVADPSMAFTFGDAQGAVMAFGAVDAGGKALPQQLQKLNLVALSADGVSITVSAKKAGAGDGFANVGWISAFGTSLGSVTVGGDLGRIDCGDYGLAVAVKSISVRSLGKVAGTQGASANFQSTLVGALGALNVASDVLGASVDVGDGSTAASIGSITIGGSLVGGELLGKGLIECSGNIGAIKVGATAADGLVGAAGAKSGSIIAGGNIASVAIAGKLVGGGGSASGSITAAGNIGSVRVGTLSGALGIVGGAGDDSGVLKAGGSMGGVTTTGGVAGAAGASSGQISAGSTLGSVSIAKDLRGGEGAASGALRSGTNMGAVSIGGTVLGGAGSYSGGILAGGALGAVTLGKAGQLTHSLSGGGGAWSGTFVSGEKMGAVKIYGGVVAGAGARSGSLLADGVLESLLVAGSIQGGERDFTGSVEAFSSPGTLQVGGALVGGAGAYSGAFVFHSGVRALSVGGALTGGSGAGSGSVFQCVDPAENQLMTSAVVGAGMVGGTGDQSGMLNAGEGSLGSVVVGKAGVTRVGMQGGAGVYSGAIYASGSIASISVAGDVRGGGAALGEGGHSASLEAGGLLQRVNITGSVIGGAGDWSAAVHCANMELAGVIKPGNIGSVVIAGSLAGGAGAQSAMVAADGNLASLQAGSVLGGLGEGSAAVRAGLNPESTGSIGTMKVLGSINGGAGADSGVAEASGDFAVLEVKGSISATRVQAGDAIGRVLVSGAVTDSRILARGQAVQGASVDLALASFSAGSVSGSLILAGYDINGVATNADAQIGAVVVVGAWSASSLVAGAVAGDEGYGVGDTLATGSDSGTIRSKIGSVSIGGLLSGTAADGDHFGFVAQEVGSFKYRGVSLALSAVGLGGSLSPEVSAVDVKLHRLV